jgi:nicotinamide-nucleotide amidase
LTVTMEILCIGNELLIGKVVNTNASWMGKRATSLGVAVRRITVAPDEIPEIVKVTQEALARKPNFIITTGGLGPTFDDKTLEGFAKALNRNLHVDSDALEMVKAKYIQYAEARNQPEGELTAPRVKMATFPKGTTVIPNPVGTAPAMQVDVDGTVLVALPGVPSEMEAIFEASVVPLLREAAGDVGFYEQSLFVSGVMESAVAPLIDKVMHDNPLVYIKSHPKGKENKSFIELHLSTSGQNSDSPQERLTKAASELATLLLGLGGVIEP